MTAAIRPTIEELRARVTEKDVRFEVPADARPTRCSSCGAMIFFATTDAGKPMPVDVLVKGGVFPRREHVTNGVHEPRVGRGASHFATCPSADEHRRAR